MVEIAKQFAQWKCPTVATSRPLDPAALISRRGVLQAALGGMAGASTMGAFGTSPVWGAEALPAPAAFWSQPRWVWLKRSSTGEEIRLVYWSDGVLNTQAHEQISWFLRDSRFENLMRSPSLALSQAIGKGELSKEQLTPWALMDPIVIDILFAYCAWLSMYGIPRALEVTSGFRHFFTNALTEGAVRDSWHTKAGAVDFLIPGISIEQVARFGAWLSGGGVGLYLSKNFTHVDRGRVRTWVKN
jgi:uncharacterized protein YcbK (DUF882 family)